MGVCARLVRAILPWMGILSGGVLSVLVVCVWYGSARAHPSDGAAHKDFAWAMFAPAAPLQASALRIAVLIVLSAYIFLLVITEVPLWRGWGARADRAARAQLVAITHTKYALADTSVMLIVLLWFVLLATPWTHAVPEADARAAAWVLWSALVAMAGTFAVVLLLCGIMCAWNMLGACTRVPHAYTRAPA